MDPYPLPVARAAFTDAVGSLSELAGSLDDEQLLVSSRARGWAVRDVLCHVHLGALELLVALSNRTDLPADTDLATYWDPSEAGRGGAAAHARFVRNVAAAYAAPRGLVAHLAPTLGACVRRADDVETDWRLAWQGRVLPGSDLLATWAVEFAVHHLDVTVELEDAPTPPATALRVTTETLDRLLGQPAPADWTITEHVLKGTGRVPLSPGDRRLLGSLAERFPLLG